MRISLLTPDEMLSPVFRRRRVEICCLILVGYGAAVALISFRTGSERCTAERTGFDPVLMVLPAFPAHLGHDDRYVEGINELCLVICIDVYRWIASY